MGKEEYEQIVKMEYVWDKYHSLIQWIAYDVLHDYTWAEDAMQETLIKLMRHLNRIDLDKVIETRNYISRVARNTSYDLYKKRKRDSDVIEFGGDICECESRDPMERNPEDFAVSDDTVKQIAKAIRNMDPIYSDPLRYQKTDHYTVEQIADITGVSVRTVYYRIEKAKRILKEELGNMGIEV